MSELILRGGTVVGPDGAAVADVHVSGGTVAAVGAELAVAGAEVLDCTGAWVGPGFVDPHTHLREPGQEWKEDVDSGSRAAVAGGYTAVIAMPNTDPPVDAGHLARFVVDRGREVGLIQVAAAGCVTAGRQGAKLAHLDDLWRAGVRLFTDDGDAVMDAGLARRAMEYLAEIGGVFAQHAEDRDLAGAGHIHEGAVSSRLGMVGRPALAEEIILARDLALVRLTGVSYHLLHASTAAAVTMVAAAKAEGLPVTAEVTPHHLTFDHEAAAGTDPAYKMNPPLRTDADVAALRTGLADGTIDMVATDHAPHAAHEKEVPFEEAPPGIIGLETAAAAVHGAVGLGPAELFDRMSVAPAARFGLAGQGRLLEPGGPANVAVFDPEADWTYDAPQSRAANTPFLGKQLRGQVRYTIYQGTVTWADGKVQG